MAVDKLSENGIKTLLNENIKNLIKIDIKETVDSTNDEVKKLAVGGEGEWYLLISRSQTKGKGRIGRSFYSPAGTGIYMSLLLRPECSAEEATLITTVAAVSVCEAFEKSGVQARIKWVNDIFVNGKKVCGILTEAGFGTRGALPDYAILGVGINMYTPVDDFPEDIRQIAGAVFDLEKENLSNSIVARFLNSFFNYYSTLSQRRHVTVYREKCFVTGKAINVISADGTIPAKAVGIDNNCNLLVEYPDGKTGVLGTGEVSIRVTE